MRNELLICLQECRSILFNRKTVVKIERNTGNRDTLQSLADEMLVW